MALGFRGSKNNTTDTIIDFEVYFNIFSNSYKKWAKINFPDLALIGGGYVLSDTTPLENMDLSLQPSFGYNFVKLDNQLIMNDIFRQYSDLAEKYFEINESWIKISSNDSIKGY
jgi:hypothetical protein